MKIAVNSARYLVGILFIFSGLVKANDPAGLGYKMHEFFEAWNLQQLNQFALTFSLLMITFEIVAGVALILGWQIRKVMWLLLLLIVFFTFLTAYAWKSGKFKSCGCFGDCIPLKPAQSFYKDLLLLGLILFLFFKQSLIKPLFKNRISVILLFLSLLLTSYIQKYALDHLPFKDCLSFKAGNNMIEKRKFTGGKKEITFVHSKDGKEFKYIVPNYPDWLSDSTYIFLRREEKVLSTGNEGDMILDFALRTTGGADTTTAILQQPYKYAFLFITDVPAGNTASWDASFAELLKTTQQKNIPVYIVTNRTANAEKYFNAIHKLNLPVFFCDEKPILAAARTRPALYLLDAGTILNKWSYKDLGKATKKIQQLTPNQ
jgi:uncharacterized membrane protein YphA (DoxX/SURF4 family)